MEETIRRAISSWRSGLWIGYMRFGNRSWIGVPEHHEIDSFGDDLFRLDGTWIGTESGR
jgi:hypothetical protein